MHTQLYQIYRRRHGMISIGLINYTLDPLSCRFYLSSTSIPLSFIVLHFSCDGKHFASLGGRDDNSVVVWETVTGRAVCGSPAAQDSAFSIKWLHHRDDRFVTAGNFHLRVWQVDVTLPKVLTSMALTFVCVPTRDGGQLHLPLGSCS